MQNAEGSEQGCFRNRSRPVTETQKSYHLTEEAAWVAQALAGDQIGFESLMRRYHAPLRRILISILHRPEDSDDMLQETFLRAYRFLHRYDPSRPFGPWLFRIGTNLARNFLKRDQTRGFVSLDSSPGSDEDETYDGAWSADQTTVEELEHRELLTRTREALSGLPHDQRVVLEMRLLGEMSYQEIAETLSIPPGTVMSRLGRGRASLQQLLAEYCRDLPRTPEAP